MPMDVSTAWQNLADAIGRMQSPEGDYELKLHTVLAGVELLFEFPAEEILAQVAGSGMPVRAIISWLVFEGGRMPEVDALAVSELKELYEATCPPGEGIIPPPAPGSRIMPS